MVGEQRGRVRNRREQAIIELVAQGLANRDIAKEIGTTEYVIKNHLRVIYDKLGLWNRVELALWYEARQQEDHKPMRSWAGARTVEIKKAGC